MANMTNNENKNKNQDKIIPPHGGYRDLKSYQTAVLIYDLTVDFCNSYISKYSRTHDQMVQAGRSGKQNIAEGSQVSGTSKKSELKLVNVARSSLEELLLDYEDFLRQNKLRQWDKDDPEAKVLRALAYLENRSHKTYEAYLKSSEQAANMLLTLINQANYLLDKQLAALDKSLREEGGITERIYSLRMKNRSDKTNRTYN